MTVACNFQQCDYCQIGNVSMGFSSPWVTENLSKSRGEAEWFWRNFLSRVVRKNSYSHFRSDSNHIVENYKQQSETNWNNKISFFKFLFIFTFFSVKLKQSTCIFSFSSLFLHFLQFFSVKVKKPLCKSKVTALF